MRKSTNRPAMSIKEQSMTSLRISELSGVSHKNVMQKLRSIEPAWVEVGGLKFQPSYYQNNQNKRQPMYKLDYEQTLYVAATFDHKTRALIVLELSALKKQQEQKELPPSPDIVIDRTMRRYATPMRYPMPSYREVQHKNPHINITDGYIHLMVNVMEYQNPIPGIVNSDEKLYLDLPGILRCFSRPYHKAIVDKLVKQIEPKYVIHTRATDIVPARRYVDIEWVDKTFGAIYGVDMKPKNEEMQLDGYFIEMKQMLDIVKNLHSPDLDKSKLTHLLMNKEVHRG